MLDFLRDLARRAKPYAERDIGELREFAAKHLAIADLQPWDLSYASEKLREQRYSYSEQELKQYFTEPRVLAGLFKVIETLFAVAIRKEAAPVWHPDVRFYRIENLPGRSGRQFYLGPLCTRPQARGRVAGRCTQPARHAARGSQLRFRS